MTNHTKLTPEQYDAINRQSYKMTPQDEAIHAGMATRHRPAHNFPEDVRVRQLEFKVGALDALVSNLMARLDKLEASPKRSNLTNLVLEEQAGEDMRMRNLPSNKREVAE